MSTAQTDALPLADQQALDRLQPVLDQLTPAGRRKLLAILAGKCLPDEGGEVSLRDEEGEVFACVYSAQRPVIDLTAELTEDDVTAIKRNLLDPKKSTPWRDVLAQLDAEDDRE